jgi:chromosome segregation ATPase
MPDLANKVKKYEDMLKLMKANKVIIENKEDIL